MFKSFCIHLETDLFLISLNSMKSDFNKQINCFVTSKLTIILHSYSKMLILLKYLTKNINKILSISMI